MTLRLCLFDIIGLLSLDIVSGLRGFIFESLVILLSSPQCSDANNRMLNEMLVTIVWLSSWYWTIIYASYVEGILIAHVHPENLRNCLQSFEWISLRTQASLRVSLWFPHWLGDSPRCSQICHNCSHGGPVPVRWEPSYSERRPECIPRVWFSPGIAASKFTLRLLSHTPGGSQWTKYILLMQLVSHLLSLISQ